MDETDTRSPVRIEVDDFRHHVSVSVGPTAVEGDIFAAIDRNRLTVPLDYSVTWDLRQVPTELLTLDVRRLLARARPPGLPSRRGPVALVVRGDLVRRWAATYEMLATEHGHRVRVCDSMDEALEWIADYTRERTRQII